MDYPNIKTKFGFGCMRLKLDQNKKVDYDEFSKMIDLFMEKGFTYFDTAHPYLDGQSEIALRECLVKRYPRDSFTITDKLSNGNWNTEKDIRPLFEKQLKCLGTNYLDFYLFHALNKTFFEKYKREHAFEVVKQLKEEGKIKHIGMSFHDSPEVLDQILTEYGNIIEVVQIQYNYLDLDNPNVQSQGCYDVCIKHNKPIIIMEPIKGGTLVNLPEETKAIFDRIKISPAQLALRFAASQPQVFMTLSGMGNLKMMEENLSFMKEIKPLTKEENKALQEIVTIMKTKNVIPCTACHYCTKGCPMQIHIPELFEIYNKDIIYNIYQSKDNYYQVALGALASSCIHCGQCENVCPQSIKIISELEKVANKYEH